MDTFPEFGSVAWCVALGVVCVVLCSFRVVVQSSSLILRIVEPALAANCGDALECRVLWRFSYMVILTGPS